MSFFSKFRPATCLVRAPFQSPQFPAPAISRSFRIASPRKVSGYGKNSSSRNLVDEDLDLDEARVREVMEDDVVNTGRPEAQRDIDTQGRPGGKMPDGGKVPNYTGPSIAEKKLDRSVNADEADAVNFPTSDQLSNEESGEAVSDSKFQQYSQQSHAKQWEGYANNLFENPERKSNAGDFDATQSEMNDVGSDLVGGMWSNKSKSGKSKNKKEINRKGSSIFDEIDSKKFYTTSSKSNTRYSDGDWVEDGVAEKDILDRDENISDIVGNGMSKVAAKARRAANKVEDVAENAKESAKEMAESAKENIKEGWDSVKEGAKKVKESVQDAAETLSTPVYEKPTFKEELYPTSDVENARGVRLNSSPEFAAEQSGDVIGDDVNSLRKGLFDGPADMPQGVGKRAKDANGQPMETGTRDS